MANGFAVRCHQCLEITRLQLDGRLPNDSHWISVKKGDAMMAFCSQRCLADQLNADLSAVPAGSW